LREIPLLRRSRNADIEGLRKKESEALLDSVPAGFRLIALDERGKQWSTMELAQQMENWMREERGVCFLVGGPDGLSQQCRQQAHNCWSLGKLTLPHPLVRTILAEQLYRAWTITQNHPYHRA
jgi:23S rRNA (pseudouridine1915-N3)-methyltransferase